MADVARGAQEKRAPSADGPAIPAERSAPAARVLRGRGAAVVPAEVVDAKAEAAAIVAAARREARAIRARAEEARETLFETARAEAADRAQANLIAAWARLQRAEADALRALRTTLAAIVAQALLRLAGPLAKASPSAVEHALEDAVARTTAARSRLRVRAHPAEAAGLSDRGWFVVPDRGVSRGGVVVEVLAVDIAPGKSASARPAATIDARLETRIEALTEALGKAWPSRWPSPPDAPEPAGERAETRDAE